MQRTRSVRSPLLQISIANPCTADWDQMQGTESTRFCALCKKNVYNLSAMTEEEVHRLLRRADELCTSYAYRPDGTIVSSASCSAKRRPSPKVAAIAAAVAYAGAFAGIVTVVDDATTRAGAAEEQIRVAMGGIKIMPKSRAKLESTWDVSPGLLAIEDSGVRIAASNVATPSSEDTPHGFRYWYGLLSGLVAWGTARVLRRRKTPTPAVQR